MLTSEQQLVSGAPSCFGGVGVLGMAKEELTAGEGGGWAGSGGVKFIKVTHPSTT